MSLAGIVHIVAAAHREAKLSAADVESGDDNEPATRPSSQQLPDESEHPTSHSYALKSYRSTPDSPSMRTGPPRSLSYTYSLQSSPRPRGHDNSDLMSPDGRFKPSLIFPNDFRSALEYEQTDRKGKKRENRHTDESWGPTKWFADSPKEEKTEFNFASRPSQDKSLHAVATQPLETKSTRISTTHFKTTTSGEGSNQSGPSTPTQKFSGLKRALTLSHDPTNDGKSGRWNRIRSLLPTLASQDRDASQSGPSTVTPYRVNITDELITGGLSTLMLRLWFERDEKDHRRVPLLFHRLRIRVSDSLHPMHSSKSVFRIECEYANGASRWVIYRSLRDFVSLHAHYAVSNVYNRNVDKMPEFPKTSLPYLKFLKKEGREIGQADFARLQRESLENYLIELIRAVMFHPSSNRLAGFLEISALSISMAQSGGCQYKAGYLQVVIDGVGGGFGRKSAGWRARKAVRWCAIRESYLVVMEEPGEVNVWDVFLLDNEFEIERPKRYYRQGLHLLHVDGHSFSHKTQGQPEAETGERSVIGSMTARFSKLFHSEDKRRTVSVNDVHGDDASSTSESIPSQAPSVMLDPSTNVNPLADKNKDLPAEGRDYSEDVSKHTFYVTNAQMRLKLFARNERQMLQWITAFEKVAATSHYVGKNRFDSFSPIRLNVAAQWLVDGRDYFWNLSRAILLARESIYIHDWWLSPGEKKKTVFSPSEPMCYMPELQLRRPGKERYRLDRLLERKAKEGVKIYIILYQEVSNRTTPTDSNYAKQRLTSLHPNVMVQRSPSHFQTGTFYWAHHEKMCVIDHTIAFMGGIDLCFGRWDTAQHALVDDTEGTDNPEIWPGRRMRHFRVASLTISLGRMI
ncbi:hypothetical protein H0H92_010252 [Tricholoma furcatifolium]|nr:hypothetical protein H0H92_010252 [Tricholoma furcatifolium]